MDRTVRIVVEGDLDGERADAALARRVTGLARNQLQRRLRSLMRNGLPVKPAARLTSGDVLEAVIAVEEYGAAQPEHFELEVIEETDEYIVVNKPAGLVVHPGAGHSHGTLVNALMGRYEGDPFFEPVEPPNRDAAFSSGQSLRPGIVHRLDRDTSGVMIVARTPRTRDFLIQRFAHREVGKRYYAIVKGVPSQRAGVVDAAIGRDPRHRVRFSIHLDTDSHQGSAAKPAVTGYRTLAAYSSGRYALIELRPQTGRTHQLRVHMAGLGHPILGDPLYARKDALRAPRLMLHAYELALRPCPVCAPRQFRATFPRDFQVVLSSLSSLDR